MKTSAGIAIILNHKKILLCHPTNQKWISTFSLPKGGIDEGESIIDAAIRETREEVSIVINKSQISNLDRPVVVNYINKNGILFKIVYVFMVYINNLSEIGLQNEVIDEHRLQLSEVDWAGFLDKYEASQKIFFRFHPVLDILK